MVKTIFKGMMIITLLATACSMAGAADEKMGKAPGMPAAQPGQPGPTGRAVPQVLDVRKNIQLDRDVVFTTINGHALKLDIAYPKDNKGKLPAVVYIHWGGFEIGLHLSQCGHKVTVLASGMQLTQPEGPHQGITFTVSDTFDYILQAVATRISDGKVTYQDGKGQEKTIEADSVVIFSGFKLKHDDALKFSGTAKGFSIIGDCSGNGGDVRKCNRIAFAAASRI